MASLDKPIVVSLETSDRQSKETNTAAMPYSSIADAAAIAYSPSALTNWSKANWNNAVLEATRSFTSQELPGIPANNKDCGPASLVTVLKSNGIFSDSGDAATQEASTRLRMTGADDPLHGTTVNQLITAARSYGLNAHKISGMEGLNAALAHGKIAIEGGAPSFVSNGVNFEGNNVNNYPQARHFVTVFGYNSMTGKYLIDNSALAPGSAPQEKTAAQMKAFMSDTGVHSGIAIAPYHSNSKLEKSGLGIAIPERKASSISENHHGSIAQKFRRAADIDIQMPLLTLRF
ncbi:MAG TPA: hypothetical protein V6C97_22085 [Oculatellaceae cyanobacterium]